MADLQEGMTGTAPDGTRVVVRGGQIVPLAPRMPVGANAAVTKELTALRGAGTVNTILDQHRDRIEGGELKIGPVANTLAPVRNFFGMGDESSRNYQSLRTDLERMRNESLRLNTGVQTDGDAQRAWNELMGNLNDKDAVLQRMNEIEDLNERAIAERRGNVDATRMQYGYGEITDDELFPGNRPAPASTPSGPPRPAAPNLQPRSSILREPAPAAERPQTGQAVLDRVTGGGGLQVGAVEDGYRYKGGNPASPSSWEKVR